MQIKKIFLASSEELLEDRQAFELMVGRLSQQWRQRQGEITFEVAVWQNFLDAMSKNGLQQEYNKAAADCDVFVMLFFTRVGPYTLQEFESAVASMQAGTGPRIYTYFRNDWILSGDIDETIKSLLDFQARAKELAHYVTTYRNADDLQYQFSQQLEKLYGEGGVDAQEIDDSTPPVRAGEIALLLAFRHLYGNTKVDLERMGAAVERAGRQVRETLYQMASEMRREHWRADKRLMERSIPIFEALTRCHPDWHSPWGQLGYALADKVLPDWRRAKECLDRAVSLRGDDVRDGYFYNYNRARCVVHLDPNFGNQPRQPADAPTREAVVELLRLVRRELDRDWENVLRWPTSEPLREWLTLNGSPRLRA